MYNLNTLQIQLIIRIQTSYQMIQKKQLIQLSKIVNRMLSDIKQVKQNQPCNQKLAIIHNSQHTIFQTTNLCNNQKQQQEYDADQLSLQQKIQLKPTKKKYKVHTVSFKKKIVKQIKQELEHTEKPIYCIFKAKAKQYDVHIKNVIRWYNLKQIKKRQGGRKPAFPQIQEKLIQYIRNNPNCRRRNIIAQAKKYMEEINNLNQDDNQKKINFSKGWYERFKARHLRKDQDDEEEQIIIKNQTNQDNTQVKIQNSEIKNEEEQDHKN